MLDITPNWSINVDMKPDPDPLLVRYVDAIIRSCGGCLPQCHTDEDVERLAGKVMKMALHLADATADLLDEDDGDDGDDDVGVNIPSPHENN